MKFDINMRYNGKARRVQNKIPYPSEVHRVLTLCFSIFPIVKRTFPVFFSGFNYNRNCSKSRVILAGLVEEGQRQ